MRTRLVERVEQRRGRAVERVQEPEARRFRGGELDQAWSTLTPRQRELLALLAQDLDQATQQRLQRLRGTDIEERRDVLRAQGERAGLGPHDLSYLERAQRLGGFA